MPMEKMLVEGSQIHKADLPKSMGSRISEPPPEITQDRTQTKNTHTQSQDRDYKS